MKNEDVVNGFYKSRIAYMKGSNLSVNGCRLYSYSSLLATYNIKNDIDFIFENKEIAEYSNSSRKHSYLLHYLKPVGIEILTFPFSLSDEDVLKYYYEEIEFTFKKLFKSKTKEQHYANEIKKLLKKSLLFAQIKEIKKSKYLDELNKIKNLDDILLGTEEISEKYNRKLKQKENEKQKKEKLTLKQYQDKLNDFLVTKNIKHKQGYGSYLRYNSKDNKIESMEGLSISAYMFTSMYKTYLKDKDSIKNKTIDGYEITNASNVSITIEKERFSKEEIQKVLKNIL